MLSDYQLLVARMIRDDSQIITPSDIDSALALALSRYSSDRPSHVVEDIAPNGTAVFNLPAQWVPAFSSLTAIEYPLDQNPPSMRRLDDARLYQKPVGVELVFAFVPESTVRLAYIIPQTLSATVDTIPLQHREGIASWAAAMLCEQLSSWFANAGDSTLTADRVDRLSQSKDYAARAKTLRTRYLDEIGTQEKKVVAAGVVVNLDLNNSLGQDRLNHSRRYR